ncbi:ECF transporter S component [Mycoplasmopsis pulmonis]|nr:ECF transporter S component [Mycoplasmopsis pulmonis]MDZ7293255.1 ECF transporter S component [Mycoplasmopsis pulmonis]VEU68057.1 Protein of uncharacterised function (DUF3816) [Mycoplasmopsis pulmonis]
MSKEVKTFYKNTKFVNYLKNEFRFTTFDIAISGILFALSLVSSLIVHHTLPPRLNIDTEILFFITFGIFFGPIKGVFLSIITDTFALILKGRIAFWMWEYAISAVFIPIIASLLYQIYKNKNLKLIFIPITIIVVSLTGGFTTFAFYRPKKGVDIWIWQEVSFISSIVVSTIVALVSLILIFLFLFLYLKTKKDIYFRIIIVICLIVSSVVLSRWLMGPYAFTNYLNRFLPSKRVRLHKDLYFTWQGPIIIKSLFTIPIYSLILVPLISVLNFEKQKYIEKKQIMYVQNQI